MIYRRYWEKQSNVEAELKFSQKAKGQPLLSRYRQSNSRHEQFLFVYFIIFRLGPHRPWGPPSPLYKEYPVSFAGGGKPARAYH